MRIIEYPETDKILSDDQLISDSEINGTNRFNLDTLKKSLSNVWVPDVSGSMYNNILKCSSEKTLEWVEAISSFGQSESLKTSATPGWHRILKINNTKQKKLFGILIISFYGEVHVLFISSVGDRNATETSSFKIEDFYSRSATFSIKKIRIVIDGVERFAEVYIENVQRASEVSVTSIGHGLLVYSDITSVDNPYDEFLLAEQPIEENFSFIGGSY